MSKLHQISGLLLKQRREFIIAGDWNMVTEQQETTSFLRLVGNCVIELSGACGTCYSGRSIDYLVVGKNVRHCVRNVRADKSAPFSAHVAIAFHVMRMPPKIRTWQLVSLSPLTPPAPSRCSENGKQDIGWPRVLFPATHRKKHRSRTC